MDHGFLALWLLDGSALGETWQGTPGGGEESEVNVLLPHPLPAPVNLPSHRALCLWGQKTALSYPLQA